MTAQEKFEETLNLWANALWTFSDNREAAIADLRSAHAACIEEARLEHLHGLEKLSVEDAYERGLREGAEREREECIKLLLYCGFEGSAAAIRAHSKGGER